MEIMTTLKEKITEKLLKLEETDSFYEKFVTRQGIILIPLTYIAE